MVHTDVSQVNDFRKIAIDNGWALPESPDVQVDDAQTELYEEPINEEPIDHGMIADLLRPLFDILAPNWKITNQEIDQLAKAYECVADKYNLGQYVNSPEVNAIIVTGIIFYPRLNIRPKDKVVDAVPEPEQELQQTFAPLNGGGYSNES